MQGWDSSRLWSPLSILCRHFLQGGDLLMSSSSPLPSRAKEAIGDHQEICSRASSGVLPCRPASACVHLLVLVACHNVHPSQQTVMLMGSGGGPWLRRSTRNSLKLFPHLFMAVGARLNHQLERALRSQSRPTTETETLNMHPESHTPA